MNRRRFLTLTATGVAGLSACKPKADANVIRFGHFPNVTHVQGLVANALSRQGKGWFEERLGVKVEWFTYNAGPSATEAIFAGALDVTYIGPSPTLNAYAKSKGTEMRVLASGANGGNALVVRPDAGINSPADFKGKKIASPQLGNTQDVQLRAWLLANGIKVTLTGGCDDPAHAECGPARAFPEEGYRCGVDGRALGHKAGIGSRGEDLPSGHGHQRDAARIERGLREEYA